MRVFTAISGFPVCDDCSAENEEIIAVPALEYADVDGLNDMSGGPFDRATSSLRVTEQRTGD